MPDPSRCGRSAEPDDAYDVQAPGGAVGPADDGELPDCSAADVPPVGPADGTGMARLPCGVTGGPVSSTVMPVPAILGRPARTLHRAGTAGPAGLPASGTARVAPGP